MTTKDPSNDPPTDRARSRFVAELILLVIYIAVGLTFAGLVHVLTPEDADAPDSSMASGPAAEAPNVAVAPGDSTSPSPGPD